MSILAAIAAVFFGICSGFLYLVSYAFQWTYQETSVYINLWLQGIVLLLSVLFVLVASTYRLFKKPSIGPFFRELASLLYFGLFVWGGKLLYLHYGTVSESVAFNLCKNDLLHLSRQMLTLFDCTLTSKNIWIGYYCVNLIIFVVLYLILLFIHYKIGRRALKASK